MHSVNKSSNNEVLQGVTNKFFGIRLVRLGTCETANGIKRMQFSFKSVQRPVQLPFFAQIVCVFDRKCEKDDTAWFDFNRSGMWKWNKK